MTIPLTSFAGGAETTNEDIEVEVTLAELAAQGDEADVDGTVDAFVVNLIAGGTLKIGTSAATATAWAPGTNVTINAVNNAGWSKDVNRWRQFGNDRPYHYYGSPWCFAQIGTAFGEGMI